MLKRGLLLAFFCLASLSTFSQSSNKVGGQAQARQASAAGANALEGTLISIGGNRGDLVLHVQTVAGQYKVWPYYPPEIDAQEITPLEKAWKQSVDGVKVGDQVRLECPEIKQRYDESLREFSASCVRIVKRNASELTSGGDAAAAYINAHFSHCGDSYYLFDYAGATPMGIREYKGMHWSIQQLPTNGADSLNGITEKIRLTISATANRDHGPRGEWSEWTPGFSTFFADPGNATGIGTGKQQIDMIRVNRNWKVNGMGFDLSNPQPCANFPT
jgi:hypothetical protein